MCTGLKEWLMDERSEGRAEGERSLLILQVQKKLDRGKTLEVIADEVEQDVETIAVIIEEINEMKGK
jgi:predicted transposase YdaD